MAELFKKASPGALFFCGLFLMAFFIFQESLAVRAGQTFLFIILSLLAGRRFRLLPNLILVAGITLVHLISPYGKILFTLGPLTVTLGALERGLYKGLLLVGLIYISRVFVSPRLRFPGTVGQLLGRTFAYFEMITENRGDFNPRRPFVSLDEMLLKLSAEDPEGRRDAGAAPEAKSSVSTGSLVLPVFLTALNGGLLLLPLFR